MGGMNTIHLDEDVASIVSSDSGNTQEVTTSKENTELHNKEENVIKESKGKEKASIYHNENEAPVPQDFVSFTDSERSISENEEAGGKTSENKTAIEKCMEQFHLDIFKHLTNWETLRLQDEKLEYVKTGELPKENYHDKVHEFRKDDMQEQQALIEKLEKARLEHSSSDDVGSSSKKRAHETGYTLTSENKLDSSYNKSDSSKNESDKSV